MQENDQFQQASIKLNLTLTSNNSILYQGVEDFMLKCTQPLGAKISIQLLSLLSEFEEMDPSELLDLVRNVKDFLRSEEYNLCTIAKRQDNSMKIDLE